MTKKEATFHINEYSFLYTGIYFDVSNFSFALMVGRLVDDMNANLLIDKHPTYMRTLFKLTRKIILVCRASFSNCVIYFIHDAKSSDNICIMSSQTLLCNDICRHLS